MSTKLVYGKPTGKSVDYLEPYCKSAFRSGFVTCNDVFMPAYFTQFADRIRRMEMRSDDVWLCSYPKTGTTWTQEMVWCIANDVDLKRAEKKLSARFPFLEVSSLLDLRDIISKNPELKFPPSILDSVSHACNLPSPRFMKTHLPYKLLPEKLRQNETNTKIVYVTRNVRDTCISFFHHYQLLEGYQGGFEEFCELFLDGNGIEINCMKYRTLPADLSKPQITHLSFYVFGLLIAVLFGSYWDHVKSFWEERNNPNLLIIRYEDMKMDLKSVIRKTDAFLGKTLNSEQLETLLDHLSFQNMKNNPAVNKEYLVELFKKFDVSSGGGSFMRKGEIGEWKTVMNAELTTRFEKWERKNLENNSSLAEFLGYTF